MDFGTAAYEHIKDSVIIFDDGSKIIYLNKAAAELYGVKKEDVIGLTLNNLFVIEWLKPEVEQASIISLKKTGYWAGQNYHLMPNGKKLSVSSSLTVFQDAFGKKRGIIALIRDKNTFQENLDENNERLHRSGILPEEISKIQLANLIDVSALQSMMDDLYAVTKIGFAIIDLKGNVIAGTGWQDICSKFHRVNPQTIWNCLESDLVLSKGVKRGEFRTYKCKNNMWDIVTPLIIGDKHVGNIFSGQFFFEDETVDRAIFAGQAEKYGFEKEAYLSALDRVPRWNRDIVRNLMQFYMKLSEMISKQSFANLRLSKSLSDQKIIENELRNIQHDLTHAQTVAKVGSWRLDVISNNLVWSDETYQMFEIVKGTPLTYENFLEFIHPQDKAYVDANWKAALRGEPYDIEHRIVVKNKVMWVHEKAELEFDKDGMLISGFGTVQDITEHKKIEETLQGLNRALRAISDSNQALMRATDEAAFLQLGCRIIVEDCGYKLVWIGFAENDENKTVRPVAYAGFDQGYIDALKISWADNERGNGPTGRAIRTGKPQVCKNMLTDPKFSAWRKQASERGYASSVVLPLMSEGKAFGALNVYSQTVNAFSDDEVKLLSELASDYAHGIVMLRIRLSKEFVEKELIGISEQRRLALEASNLGSWDYNLDTDEVFWDERCRDMFGIQTGDKIGYTEAIEKIHPDDKLGVDRAVKKAIEGVNGGKYDREFRVIKPDGTISCIASHGKVYFEHEGDKLRATRFIGVNKDITKRK